MQAFFLKLFTPFCLLSFYFTPLICQETESVKNLNFSLEPQSYCCKENCRACLFKQGPTGPTGPTGATGATGPAGSSLATFISLYALNAQTVNNGAPILFDAVSAQNGPIVWPGANNGEILISNAGIYSISFGIQLLFNGTISLQINNVNVPGTTLSSDLSIHLPVITIDVQIPAGATVSIVNTGIAPLTLSSAGPDPTATIAFIEIHQIL